MWPWQRISDPRLDRLPAAVHRRLGREARRSRGSCAACGRARAATDRLRRASARRGTGPAPSRTCAEREVAVASVGRCRHELAGLRGTARTRTPPRPRREISGHPGASAVMRLALRPPGGRRCTNAPAASPTSFAPAFARVELRRDHLVRALEGVERLEIRAGDRFAGQHLRRRDVLEVERQLALVARCRG